MKKGIIIVLITLISIVNGLNNVNASTITSYDTYKNYQNGNSSCGTSGKYSYTTTLPNVQGGNLWETGTINKTVSGKAHDIALSFNTTLLANTYYDITINFMSNDLRYNVKRDNITLYSGSSCQDLGTNNLALVSFTNTATSSKNTNNLKIRVYSSTINNYWTILIKANNNEFLTSINNFGIKNIDIVQIEDNSTEDIINNQTNNTENIINNNNANTDKLENTIKDNLNSCRGSVNLFDKNNIKVFNSTVSYYNEGFIISSTTAWGWGEYTTTLNPGTYTLSGKITGNVDFIEIYKNNVWLIGANLNTSPYTFTINEETFITFRFYATTGDVTKGSTTFYKIQLQKGSNATPYEEYGIEICNNKLDDVNNTLQETNDILTGEQDYNKDASEEVEGKEEINDYTQKEEELFSKLNFEGIGNNEITINPNTSTFIWQIVEKLRGMNGKIILLMTSILGLGIIKMILNR